MKRLHLSLKQLTKLVYSLSIGFLLIGIVLSTAIIPVRAAQPVENQGVVSNPGKAIIRPGVPVGPLATSGFALQFLCGYVEEQQTGLYYWAVTNETASGGVVEWRVVGGTESGQISLGPYETVSFTTAGGSPKTVQLLLNGVVIAEVSSQAACYSYLQISYVCTADNNLQWAVINDNQTLDAYYIWSLDNGIQSGSGFLLPNESQNLVVSNNVTAHTVSVSWTHWPFGYRTISVTAPPQNCVVATPTLTATATATATSTFTPTSTATDTPTSTPTSTPTDTATPTSTPTATATSTDTPTSTPTSTATNTPTAIPSNTPTNTPTVTPTTNPTNTPTSTPTSTIEVTATFTPTATNTPTDTPVPTFTPTPVITDTPVPTETPVNTDTPVPTVTQTQVLTDTPVPTATPVDTNTPAPTPTPTDVISGGTPTPGSTSTPTPVIEVTPTTDGTSTPQTPPTLPPPPRSTPVLIPVTGADLTRPIASGSGMSNFFINLGLVLGGLGLVLTGIQKRPRRK